MKYYLVEYFGIDVQIKVVDFEEIPSIWLISPLINFEREI